MHSTRLVLLSVPPEFRRSVSDGLRDSGTVYAFPADVAQPPAAAASAAARSTGILRFARLLGAPAPGEPDVSEAIARYTTLPAQVRFTATPGPRYWVSQVIDGEPWWIVVLAGRPPNRKLLCRTFSDCTTAPRNGIVSGCYPLDPHYKRAPEAKALAQVKARAKAAT